MENNAKFKGLAAALKMRGLYIVFLTRLSPIFPFPALNYGYGVTEIRLRDYIIGTFGGVLPATVGYTYLGTLMRGLTEMWKSNKFSGHNLIYIGIGVAVTILIMVAVTVITKRAIKKATLESEMETKPINGSYHNAGDITTLVINQRIEKNERVPLLAHDLV